MCGFDRYYRIVLAKATGAEAGVCSAGRAKQEGS